MNEEQDYQTRQHKLLDMMEALQSGNEVSNELYIEPIFKVSQWEHIFIPL